MRARAANARLRELLAAKDAQIGAPTRQLEGVRAQVADLAAQVRQNSANSSRPPSSDGLGKPGARTHADERALDSRISMHLPVYRQMLMAIIMRPFPLF